MRVDVACHLDLHAWLLVKLCGFIMTAELTFLCFRVGPSRSYGAATLGCVGLGWLAGPVVGNTLWRLSHRRVLQALEIKDRGASSSEVARPASRAMLGVQEGSDLTSSMLPQTFTRTSSETVSTHLDSLFQTRFPTFVSAHSYSYSPCPPHH